MELKPRELTLPVWAQEELLDLRKELEHAIGENRNLRVVNSIAQEKEWFTIPGPVKEEDEGWRSLYTLERDACAKVCTLYPEDVLLVGRARKK